MNDIKIFISYASADYAIVTKIATALNKYGINTFVAQRNIQSGENWSDIIKNNLITSKLFLALITENYNNSPYANQEAGMADRNKMPILPIRLDNSTPKGLLSKIQANKFDINSSKDVKDLVERIKNKCMSFNLSGKMNDIKLEDQLQKKYGFNGTDSSMFGNHQDLKKLDVMLHSNDNIIQDVASRALHTILYPCTYFIVQPQQNLKLFSDDSKKFFKSLADGKEIKIQNNLIILYKREQESNIDFIRYYSKYAKQSDYLQHYDNGSVIQAVTNPLLNIENNKLYLSLQSTTMSLLSFVIICRDYYKYIKYEDSITFGIAIKRSIDMTLSDLKSNGKILRASKRSWMREDSNKCDYNDVYSEQICNVLELTNVEIMKIVKYFTSKILGAYKYDEESSIFDQNGMLGEDDFKKFNDYGHTSSYRI